MQWSWKYQLEKELIITKPVTENELIRFNCRFCVYVCVIDENTFQWFAWHEEKLLVSVNKLLNGIQKKKRKTKSEHNQLVVYILESIPSIDFFYGQNTFRCMQLSWNMTVPLTSVRIKTKSFLNGQLWIIPKNLYFHHSVFHCYVEQYI